MAVITDKFGCNLAVGDYILFVPVGGSELWWGEIESFRDIALFDKNHSSWTINIVENDLFTQPHRCVKFSQEEVLMRKLSADIMTNQ